MNFLLKLVIIPGLLVSVKTEHPLNIEDSEVTVSDASFDTSTYRIPEDLDPIHFDVEITPHFDEPEEGKEAFTFDGIVTMTIRVCIIVNIIS